MSVKVYISIHMPAKNLTYNVRYFCLLTNVEIIAIYGGSDMKQTSSAGCIASYMYELGYKDTMASQVAGYLQTIHRTHTH